MTTVDDAPVPRPLIEPQYHEAYRRTMLRLLGQWATECHESGLGHARRSIEDYRKAGQHLVKAREACRKQGIGFLVWLAENVKAIKQTRAYHYINLAEFIVTKNDPLTGEELESAWRRISRNDKAKIPPEDEPQLVIEDDGTPTPTPAPAEAKKAYTEPFPLKFAGAAELDAFSNDVEALQRHYGTTSPTETVVKVVKDAVEALRGKELSVSQCRAIFNGVMGEGVDPCNGN